VAQVIPPDLGFVYRRPEAPEDSTPFATIVLRGKIFGPSRPARARRVLGEEGLTLHKCFFITRRGA